MEEEELNRLLGIVVDVENLFICVHKEEDAETKQVYFYLFKVMTKKIFFNPTSPPELFCVFFTNISWLMFNSCVCFLFFVQLLRKCILNMSKPSIEGPLGNPPFEKPGIAKVNAQNFRGEAMIFTLQTRLCNFSISELKILFGVNELLWHQSINDWTFLRASQTLCCINSVIWLRRNGKQCMI